MNNKIRLEISPDDSDVAYVYLPDHPGNVKEPIVYDQIALSELINNYKGPELYLDVDKAGRIIGIEILA